MSPIRSVRNPAARARPALALVAVALLFTSGCGYEIQVSQPGTATPGPLNVHVVGRGSATPAAAQTPDVAALIRQYLGTPAPVAAPQSAAAAPATPAPQVTPVATAASAAAAATPGSPVRYDALAIAPAESRPVQPSDAPAGSIALNFPPAADLTGRGPSSNVGVAATPAATAVPVATAAAVYAAVSSQPLGSTASASAAPLSATTGHVTQAGMRLQAGSNSLVYEGAAMPVSQALSALTGLFSVVYITPPNQAQTLTYYAGNGTGPLLLTGSILNITMLRAVTVDLPAGPGN